MTKNLNMSSQSLNGQAEAIKKEHVEDKDLHGHISGFCSFSGDFFTYVDRTYFEEGLGSEHDVSHLSRRAAISVEENAELKCPSGCRRYETLAFSRPDMFEVERLSLTRKYEEMLAVIKLSLADLQSALVPARLTNQLQRCNLMPD
uniref:30S ribosomal protein S6 alpha, chloroplastic n=1 Tax=Tanacetum cinerariifolium TaxID=118510 RepID=A0A6L2K6U2_TANCI|nr:30S ribosomal protein S6 alpha, chloroplastic [Tanacetum cinerariifolium]